MLAVVAALDQRGTNNMIYDIGDLLAHYSIATGRLLDTCIIVDRKEVWRKHPNSDYVKPPEIQYTLHFTNSNNMNGVYDGYAFRALTLMKLKDYGEKYGQQITNRQ